MYDDLSIKNLLILSRYGGEIRVDINDREYLNECRRVLSAWHLGREVKIMADSPVNVYFLIKVHARACYAEAA